MVHSVTHYYMITSITTITTDSHYYINTHYYYYYHDSTPLLGDVEHHQVPTPQRRPQRPMHAMHYALRNWDLLRRCMNS